MNNDFLDLVKSRHSVREYSTREVEQDKLDYILEAARLAPSAVNKQPWHFIVVKSEKKKRDLHGCYDRDWFKNAPLYIIIYVMEDIAWTRGSDNKNHCDVDGAIATEHICLAATEMGLGTCWVCNFDVERCKSLFEIGDNAHPVAIIPIGYPANVVRKKAIRKDIDDIFSEV